MSMKFAALKTSISKIVASVGMKTAPKIVVVTPPLLTKTVVPVTFKTVLLGVGTKIGLYSLGVFRKLALVAVGFYGVYAMIQEAWGKLMN